jgi:hypothetical protein
MRGLEIYEILARLYAFADASLHTTLLAILEMRAGRSASRTLKFSLNIWNSRSSTTVL